MGIDGSGVRDLSKTLDRDPDNLRWAPDAKGVYFTAPDRGSINVRYADLAGGVPDRTQGAQAAAPPPAAPTPAAAGRRTDPAPAAPALRPPPPPPPPTPPPP